jgi:hypothetical protein
VRSIVLALLLLPALALAQAAVPAPRLLPYQGRLLRADGSPETGPQWLTFRIYGAPDATTALWTEAQSVPLMNGFYAVFLGAVSTFPDSLFDGHDRWLGVTVGDGQELAPRQQMASVAYAVTSTNALRAATADLASNATLAARASVADHASTAAYAEKAGSAANADTATRTARADRATFAESAATATTASRLDGTGDVEAAVVHATMEMRTEGSVVAGSVSTGSADINGGDLTLRAGGNLILDGGKIIGGYRLVGLARHTKITFRNGQAVDEWADCKAIGAAECHTQSEVTCRTGERATWNETPFSSGTDSHFGSGVTYEYVCVEGP